MSKITLVSFYNPTVQSWSDIFLPHVFLGLNDEFPTDKRELSVVISKSDEEIAETMNATIATRKAATAGASFATGYHE